MPLEESIKVVVDHAPWCHLVHFLLISHAAQYWLMALLGSGVLLLRRPLFSEQVSLQTMTYALENVSLADGNL